MCPADNLLVSPSFEQVHTPLHTYYVLEKSVPKFLCEIYNLAMAVGLALKGRCVSIKAMQSCITSLPVK